MARTDRHMTARKPNPHERPSDLAAFTAIRGLPVHAAGFFVEPFSAAGKHMTAGDLRA
jgi:hypothetical protein